MALRYSLALHLHFQRTGRGVQTYTTCIPATATRQFGTSVRFGGRGLCGKKSEGGCSSALVFVFSVKLYVCVCVRWWYGLWGEGGLH